MRAQQHKLTVQKKKYTTAAFFTKHTEQSLNSANRTLTQTHLYFMPVCFPVDSLSEMWRGVKEPKLRAMMATVRNLALAWFTTLGLVAFCLLCSPFPLFRLWSVQAMDTCMAALRTREQSSRQRGRSADWKDGVDTETGRRSLKSQRVFYWNLLIQCLVLFSSVSAFRFSSFTGLFSFLKKMLFSLAHFQKLCLHLHDFFSVNQNQAIKAFPLLFFYAPIKSSILSLSF